MNPSSYALGGLFGSHGFILFPEPGTRAPDTPDRKRAAEDETVKIFNKYLESWCKSCGKCSPRKKDWNRKYPKGKNYGEDF